MDVVSGGDLFKTGESIFISVRSVPDAVHDVDDFEVGDTIAMKCFDDGVPLSNVLGDCVCRVCA